MSTRTIMMLVVAVNLATGSLVGIALDRTVLQGSHGPEGFGGPGGMGHGPRGPDPIKSLGLDPEQEVQVRAIMDRHRSEFEKARAEERARMSTVRDQIDLEIKGVVTPAQYTKLVEIRHSFEKDEADHCGPKGN